MLWGSLGVLAFSLTLPATRAAVTDLDGTVVGLGRAVVAAVPAAVLLLATRQPVPPRRLWLRLTVTAGGVVFGFPVLSAWALSVVPSAHAAIIVGFMPAATAVAAVIRAGERPSLGFWLTALCGLAAILAFAAVQGAGRPQPADALILIAVVLGAIGYAEGGYLAREIGGWQVISWVLVMSVPVLLPIVAVAVARHGIAAAPVAWLGFGYVSLVSMYLGFFAWYRALALGGIARIGQIQLAQPVLTLIWSAWLLGEHVTGPMVVAACAVLASVALAQRTRVAQQNRGDPPG